MVDVKVSKSMQDGRILVSFLYNPKFVAKVKSIDGYKWHPDKKYWSFPDTDGTLQKILKVFEGKEIHLDSALQDRVSVSSVIARSEATKQSQKIILAKGGKGGFEDLRRELLSRKYSYKTVKGYL